ncbi:MAG: phosphatase PAP2 family protein [Sphaerobacter sp.]|nr:phosphatase PAP2 family protein [Sphaerobacter sp.]
MKPRARIVVGDAAIQRARHGVVEFGIVAGLFALYYATRGLVAGKELAAFQNAREVMHLERRLGLFRELGVQALLLAQPWIVHILNWIYTYTHMAGLGLFGIWLFWRHTTRYREYRNIFLGILGVGLLIYALFPLAPPRFFPYSGFVDTLALYSGVNYDQPSVAMLYNPFAAMPSLHVAFALFCGIGVIRVGRRLLHWVIGTTFPLLMITAVVGTGNHYILDAIAGSLLTVLAYLLVPRLLAAVDRYRRQPAERAALLAE